MDRAEIDNGVALITIVQLYRSFSSLSNKTIKQLSLISIHFSRFVIYVHNSYFAKIDRYDVACRTCPIFPGKGWIKRFARRVQNQNSFKYFSMDSKLHFAIRRFLLVVRNPTDYYVRSIDPSSFNARKRSVKREEGKYRREKRALRRSRVLLHNRG